MRGFRVIRPPKKVLDPCIFAEDEKLVPGLKDKIVSETHQFASELNISPDKILGIYMIGSSVGYSWYPEADIDINVLIDWEKTPKLMGPTVWAVSYKTGREVEKPVTYYFTKDIGAIGTAYDVLAEEFITRPIVQYKEVSEEAIYWVKRWFSRIGIAISELKLDLYSYEDTKKNYELALQYGSEEQIESLEEDLRKVQAEIEKDIQVLRLIYKLLTTFRGSFVGDDFKTSIGNVVYKSVEYVSYKRTIKQLLDVYKKFRSGSIDFDEMVREMMVLET